MCNFVVRIILEVENVGNCEEDIFTLKYMSTENSVCERDRESESEEGKSKRKESIGLSIVPASFVILEFLTPTLPHYKTEANKL